MTDNRRVRGRDLADRPCPADQEVVLGEIARNEAGGPISSALLVVNPVERYQYEHLEYKPLVNARAHSLGQRRQIVNARFDEQYHHFLKMLSYRGKLSDDEQLAASYYLLLQDRIVVQCERLSLGDVQHMIGCVESCSEGW